jgi:hypothetical protein
MIGGMKPEGRERASNLYKAEVSLTIVNSFRKSLERRRSLHRRHADEADGPGKQKVPGRRQRSAGERMTPARYR